MAYNKKTWKDRQSEYPNRRILVPTGTANEYEVSRSEGLIVEEGDLLNAENFNDMEQRIADEFKKLRDDYDYDGDGVVDNAAKLGGKTPGQLTFGADQIITDEGTDKRLPQTLEEKMDKSGGKFTGAVDIATMINLVGDSWNAFTYKSTDGKTRGSIMISNNNRIHFNQQQTGSEFEERYQLPELTAGLTADVWYTIITSKGGSFAGTAQARSDTRTITYSPGELVNTSIRDSSGNAVSTRFLIMIRK